MTVDIESFERTRVANHEAGHAVVSCMVDGVGGVARVYRSNERHWRWTGFFHARSSRVLNLEGGNTSLPFMRQRETISPVTSIAGMVAESMFCVVDPVSTVGELCESWRINARKHCGESDAIPDDVFAKAEWISEHSDGSPAFAHLPSDSDLKDIPSDWSERERILSEAVDHLADNANLFLWFRDGLLEYGTMLIDQAVVDYWNHTHPHQ